MEGKVLITGVSGMIGRRLARYLLEQGCEVHGAARFSAAGSREEISEWGVTTWRRDLVADSLDDMPDFDYVFHEAVFWTKNLDVPIVDPEALSMSTVSAGRIMARWNSARAVVLASTGGIYRCSPTPANEDTPVAPNSDTYHLGKFAMEQVGLFCSREFGVPAVVLRYFWPVDFADIVERTVRAVAAGQPVPGGDPGEPHEWTPIDIEDLCYYTWRSVEAAAVPPRVLVCGGGEVARRAELAAVAAEALGVEPVVEKPPADQDLYLADSSRLFELFGRPRRLLSEMVRARAEELAAGGK
jgi:nucleoside-diphosphate-sugar epimerase